MKKYLLLTLYSVLHNGRNRKEVIIRSFFFLVILYIFSKLWEATQFSNHANPQSMIWYLSVTELIILASPSIQVEIENDIRSGDIVYQLLKPVNYLGIKISESLGSFFFRFAGLLLISVPFCIYISSYIPSPHILFVTYLSAALAGVVFLLFHMIIGLLAFKLQDSSPIYWVWQRSSFLFGGLLIPLDFYPGYLKTAAHFLPFASLLYSPAHLIMEFSPMNFLLTIAGLLFWGCVAFLLMLKLYTKMLKSLKVNGG